MTDHLKRHLVSAGKTVLAVLLTYGLTSIVTQQDLVAIMDRQMWNDACVTAARVLLVSLPWELYQGVFRTKADQDPVTPADGA